MLHLKIIFSDFSIRFNALLIVAIIMCSVFTVYFCQVFNAI